MAMTADEWKARLNAITRAKANGDDGPLAILCDQLAAMSEKCEAKPLPTTLHDYEPAKKSKAKTAMALLETEHAVATETPPNTIDK